MLWVPSVGEIKRYRSKRKHWFHFYREVHVAGNEIRKGEEQPTLEHVQNDLSRSYGVSKEFPSNSQLLLKKVSSNMAHEANLASSLLIT